MVRCIIDEVPSGLKAVAASEDIEEAFRQWLGNKAYIDGSGNYHTKGSNVSGPIALWNKIVKRAFASVGAFHAAAHAWKEQRDIL